VVKGRLINIPICYEQPYALDLEEISNLTGLNKKEIVDLHTGSLYQVFMLGFLPGFPYLGVLPQQLHLSRKKTPRLNIPERAVGIAGLQTGIYPTQSPGGWNILGSTPVPVFESSGKDPFLLRVGDQVKFEAIGTDEYLQMREKYQNE
jgi:inhibitor of KinA